MTIEQWETILIALGEHLERTRLGAAHKEEVESLIPVVARNALACVDCFACVSEWEDQEYIMVKDKLWQEIAGPDHRDMLCATCMENRIGRRLRSDDLTDAPVNRHWKAQSSCVTEPNL